MASNKMDKSIFMGNGVGPHDLPEVCQTCYGYSNWGGDDIPYADKDCEFCDHKPSKDFSAKVRAKKEEE